MADIKRVLIRKDPAGYEVWRETSVLPTYFAEEIRDEPDDSPQSEEVSEMIAELEGASGQTVTMEVAYTPAGDYIGTPEVAQRLCVERGIAPERVQLTNPCPDGPTIPKRNVCSIGFSAREQKWYGWSHRAIFGFGVGAIAKEGDCVCSSGWTEEYLADHPEEDLSLPVGFEAKTLNDAKRMAIAFAESVG